MSKPRSRNKYIKTIEDMGLRGTLITLTNGECIEINKYAITLHDNRGHFCQSGYQMSESEDDDNTYFLWRKEEFNARLKRGQKI